MKKAIHIFLIFFLTVNTVYSQIDLTIKTNDIGALFIEGINNPPIERQNDIVSQVFSEKLIAEKGVEGMVNLFKRLNTSYAPLVYHHTEINQFNKPSGTVYVMHIYAKKIGGVMWQDFQLYIDNPPVQKINNLVFIAEVAEPINLPNGSIQQKETIGWLDKYIEKLKKETDLSGSILIAEGKQIIFERHYGFADVARKVPVTSSTLFNMASGGKMFTALGIAKLVENGIIKYDDKITKYLDGFSDESKAEKVTIHHLLSHTSGIVEYWSGQTDKDVYNATTINDHLKLVYQAGFDFESGAQYQYCNSNFILLGAIIEKVSRQSFYEFVKGNIFDPADMTVSGYYNHASAKTAVPLARGEKGNVWIEAKHGIRGSSAGGSYSNVTDILKFSNALINNVIVSKQAFKNMVSVKNKGLDVTEDYGYGFIIQKSAQEITYGHGGTAGGVNFEFRYFPKQNITLVLFCNQNNGAYDDLKRNAIKLISGDR